MKPGLVEMVFILDRSDSLSGIEKDSAMDVAIKEQMSKALDEIEED